MVITWLMRPINLVHTMIKQFNVQFNGILLNPQTDTYSIRAYLATLFNYTPGEGKALLAPEGWWPPNVKYDVVPLDAPAALTANNLDYTTPHADNVALPDTQKAFVRESWTQKKKIQGGAWRTYYFRPIHEVFFNHRILPPGIEQKYQFTFHPAKYYLNGQGAVAKDLHKDDFEMKFHMSLVTLDPMLYKSIATARHTKRQNVNMANIRSECRIFTMPANVQDFNEGNLFQGRIPQRMIVGLLHPDSVNGAYTRHPFCFQKFLSAKH